MPQDAVSKYEPVFLEAVARVLAAEGGYVDNPADPGGETNFGISKRSYPDLDIKNLTAEQATAIYWNDFWLKPGFYRLKGDIAAKVFNLGVTMGAKHVVICLQRALRACGISAVETGELDLGTALAANTCATYFALMAALRSEAAGYYRETADINRSDAVFLKGWMMRAYS